MAEAMDSTCAASTVMPSLHLERSGADGSPELEVRQPPAAQRPALAYRVVGIVLTAAVVACLITYLVHEREALLAAVNRLSYLAVAGVVATLIAQWVARTARDQLIYRELGYTVSFMPLFSVYLIQMLLNYLPMKPGTVYAAYALRRHAGLQISHFGAVFLVHNLLMVITAAASAAMVIAVHPASNTATGRTAFMFLTSVSVLSTLAAIFADRLSTKVPGRIGGIIGKLAAGFSVMRGYPRMLYMTLALSFVTFALATFRMHILYGCTSQSITLTDSVVVTAAGQLAIMISITPAAIGIRELLVGMSSPLVAASTAAGVIAASLERVIVLLCLVIILLPLHWATRWTCLSARAHCSDTSSCHGDLLG